MARWILARHAEAAWDGHADHDRPLTPRGEADARAMGAWLREAGWAPDRVVASSARRAQDTARLMLSGAGIELAVTTDDGLYLGAVPDVGGRGTVLVVGHDPAVSRALRRWAPALEEPADGQWMPPGALACLEDGRLVHWKRPTRR